MNYQEWEELFNSMDGALNDDEFVRLKKKNKFKDYLWAFYQLDIEEIHRNCKNVFEIWEKGMKDLFEKADKFYSDDLGKAGQLPEGIYEKLRKSPKYMFENKDRDQFDLDRKNVQDLMLFVRDENGRCKEKYPIKLDENLLSSQACVDYIKYKNDMELLKKLAEEGGVENAREEVTCDAYKRLVKALDSLGKNIAEEKNIPEKEKAAVTDLKTKISKMLEYDALNRDSMINALNSFERKFSILVESTDKSGMNALENTGEVDKENCEKSFDNNIKNDITDKKGKEDAKAKRSFSDELNIKVKSPRMSIADYEGVEGALKKIKLCRDATFNWSAKEIKETYGNKLLQPNAILKSLGGEEEILKGYRGTIGTKGKMDALMQKANISNSDARTVFYRNYKNLYDALNEFLKKEKNRNKNKHKPLSMDERTPLLECLAKMVGVADVLNSLERHTKIDDQLRAHMAPVIKIRQFCEETFLYLSADENATDKKEKQLGEFVKKIKLQIDYNELMTEENKENNENKEKVNLKSDCKKRSNTFSYIKKAPKMETNKENEELQHKNITEPFLSKK